MKFGGIKTDFIYECSPLSKVKKITDKTYTPHDTTPLFDAIGKSIDSIHDNSNVLFAIITDGEENASTIYKKQQIKDMIKEKENTGKWTFVYIGANQDAWAEGMALGIAGQHTHTYAVGQEADMYNALSIGTRSFCSTGTISFSDNNNGN
jgi:hypothetical protein